MTQTEVAAILGTSQTMYARYERGANELPLRHLITLCQYYHVSADYILGLDQNMTSLSSPCQVFPWQRRLFFRLFLLDWFTFDKICDKIEKTTEARSGNHEMYQVRP